MDIFIHDCYPFTQTIPDVNIISSTIRGGSTYTQLNILQQTGSISELNTPQGNIVVDAY